ncbi:MAG: DUF6259 domain-containing protein [Verrucomicrobiae bacterium]|nr:DUF6259 domain-containing protein [Verrucomicrobiae bacterium]
MNNQNCESFEPKISNGRLTMAWGLEKLRVEVAIELREGLSYWNIKVDNKTDQALCEVDFPFIGGIGPIGLKQGKEDYLALPWQWGILVQDPLTVIANEQGAPPFWDGHVRRLHELAYEYPGMYSMQFLAYGNAAQKQGLYFGAHDGEANYKCFGFYGQARSRTVDYILKQYPKDLTTPGRSYSMPFAAVVGIYEGNWGAASGIYKRWALGQPWCKRGRISQRRDLPAWAKKVGLWYWNWRYWQRRGEPSEVLPALVDLKKRAKVPLAFHWYGWDDKPCDVDYPEYKLTPKARQRLAAALRQYRREGIRIIPYMNGRLWNIDTACWNAEKAGRYACQKEKLGDDDGNHYYVEPYADRPFVPMCPSTDFWQKKMAAKVETVLDYGVDGVYVDQVSSAAAVLCFARDHGHSVGGNYWYQGYAALMERMRRKVRQRYPEAVFTSESVIECFIGHFDAFLGYQCVAFSFHRMFGPDSTSIPLFTSVYSGFIPLYGTGATIQNEEEFFVGTALDICGGVQPSVQGYFADCVNRPEYEPRLRFLLDWVQKYELVKARLLDAEWIQPDTSGIPTWRVKVGGLGKTLPTICVGAWRNEANEIAVFAVNYTKQKRRMDIGLPEQALRRAASCRVNVIGNENGTAGIELTKAGRLTGLLAPRSIAVAVVS